jgi:hypothetical protein
MILCSIIPIIWYANKYHSFSPFLVLEKGGSNLFLQYFERPGLEYFSFETTIFIKSKQLKVFNTLIFNKNEVFSKVLQKYFKTKRGLSLLERFLTIGL